MRQIALPSGANAILSDTVGFITDLPTSLVAAFRATLEEVLSADLIVHVRDISHPDTEAQKQRCRDRADRARHRRRGSRHAHGRSLEQDRSADPRRSWTRSGRRPGAAPASTCSPRRKAPGLSTRLLEAVDRRLAANRAVVELDLDYNSGAIVAWLHRHGEVLERTDDGTGLHLKVAIAAPERAQLAHKLGRPV